MLSSLFKRSETQERMHEGPLGGYIDAYAALLQKQGYSWDHAAAQIRLLAKLSRWLCRQGLGPADLNFEHIARYLRYRNGRTVPDGVSGPR